ncbi:MAG: ATP-dependent metallopeptidase FtsH/Yme1/Tma family protein [Alphaproteobacteria bacterium]|nr:ATP-dependent metallopeptidase FtsH/Yme1/Tma family protein [Alphaproteobacteria bacterium]
MNNFRNLALWVIIGLLALALFQLFQGAGARTTMVPLKYSDFVADVEAGNVRSVKIEGDRVTGIKADGSQFQTQTPFDPQLVERLLNKGVQVEAASADDGAPSIIGLLLSWFPMLLLIGVWVFFMRQMQSGGGKAMGFGKSRAKLLTERHGRVTFEDVAGIDEAKEELQEIVDFLKDPQKFQRLGGKIPKGALLVGPPGTGKTLLARAIAGEANVPFFTISGSDFVEMFVGVGASRVRDMFEQAKKNAPCIIFIDEIDAVGRHRGAGLGGGNDEREQTLNQLLVEMDGFEANEGVILIAATNRPDVLDPALLRPGRFDRQIVVPNPDITGREKILKVHMRKVPLGNDVDAKTIARGTPGFSGADLANLINEAALLAARRGKRVVTMAELEDAKDKVMMGAERRSMVITEDEKRKTAYHEAGHALVALHCEASDPVHKATIIPRGRALGMVMRLPERDSYSYARDKMYANLAVSMGGRVAEEIILGYDKVTSGASGDIQMATNLARSMVTKWGMSDKLGPLLYASNEEEVFLGHSVARTQNISEETARLIDSEIKRLVEEAYQRARQILTDHIGDLHVIAKALLEYETLSGEEIQALLRGEAPVRPDATPSETPRGPASSVPPAGRPREQGGFGGLAPQPGD